MTGEKGVGGIGWGWVGATDWQWWAAPPLDPSTWLRVSGPAGWIHAIGALAAGSGAGMLRLWRTGSPQSGRGGDEGLCPRKPIVYVLQSGV